MTDEEKQDVDNLVSTLANDTSRSIEERAARLISELYSPNPDEYGILNPGASNSPFWLSFSPRQARIESEIHLLIYVGI